MITAPTITVADRLARVRELARISSQSFTDVLLSAKIDNADAYILAYYDDTVPTEDMALRRFIIASNLKAAEFVKLGLGEHDDARGLNKECGALLEAIKDTDPYHAPYYESAESISGSGTFS